MTNDESDNKEKLRTAFLKDLLEQNIKKFGYDAGTFDLSDIATEFAIKEKEYGNINEVDKRREAKMEVLTAVLRAHNVPMPRGFSRIIVDCLDPPPPPEGNMAKLKPKKPDTGGSSAPAPYVPREKSVYRDPGESFLSRLFGSRKTNKSSFLE